MSLDLLAEHLAIFNTRISKPKASSPHSLYLVHDQQPTAMLSLN
jgi:hypothetical protein